MIWTLKLMRDHFSQARAIFPGHVDCLQWRIAQGGPIRKTWQYDSACEKKTQAPILQRACYGDTCSVRANVLAWDNGLRKRWFSMVFLFFLFVFSVFVPFLLGKKTRWQRTIEKATLQCLLSLLVCTGPGHFVLSQGVHAISEVRQKNGK